MRFTNQLTDGAALEEIGLRLERRRLELNMTQAELAEEAGLGKRTIERIENGKACQLGGFLRILRVLGWQERLELLFPEPKPSPMELLQNAGKARKRASKRNEGDRVREEAKPWVWGDADDDEGEEEEGEHGLA